MCENDLLNDSEKVRGVTHTHIHKHHKDKNHRAVLITKTCTAGLLGLSLVLYLGNGWLNREKHLDKGTQPSVETVQSVNYAYLSLRSSP